MRDTRQPRPSHYVAPVAPTSAREGVVSEDEDEDEDVPDLLGTPTFRPGAKDSWMSTVVPSASAITGTPAAILFFDAPSPSPQQSVEAPLISIAQYFNRKAGERSAALADVDVDVAWWWWGVRGHRGGKRRRGRRNRRTRYRRGTNRG